MKYSKVLSLVGTLALSVWFVVAQLNAQQSAQQQHAGNMKHTIVTSSQIQWQPGPDSLPPGAEFAVLEGDPTREGPFTMRIRLPSNYRIPPHTHPKVERVTVLKGEVKLGMGRSYEEQKMERLPVGGFFIMPPGMEHFAGTDGETIIQLNGEGPWGIRYLNPADDPRQRN